MLVQEKVRPIAFQSLFRARDYEFGHFYNILGQLETDILTARSIAEISRAVYENQFLDFYDVAPLGFVSLNVASEITECNLTAALLLGVERKKLLLRAFTEWIAWENCDMWQRQFAQLKNQQGQLCMDLRMQRADGGVFIAQVDCICMVNKFQVQSIRIILTDITERKAKEQLFITRCSSF